MDHAINVAVRVRPNLKSNTKSTITIIDSEETPVLVVSDKRNAFAFDHVFSENVQQCEIYNITLKPMISKVISGYNCTILAYGQTGTGKTYTMGTDSERYNDNNPGLIPRVLDDLFDISSDENISLSISFIEIYNEKAYDLLSATRNELIVKGFEVKNLTPISLKTNEDAQHWLQIGGKNRHVRFTTMNATSSRSHAIFTVYCRRHDSQTLSKLHLIDLAGSESVRRTGNQGTPLKEGVTINRGLLTLGRVISALSDRNQIRIPYRESMLTRILQDSLNINNFVSLLVCVSPSEDDLSETLNTLRFANEAKLLKSKPKLESIVAEYDRDHPGILGIIEPLTTVKKNRFRPKMFTSTSIKKPRFVEGKNRQTIDSPPYSSTMDSLSVSHSTVIDVSQQQINFSPIVRQFKEMVNNTMMRVNNIINERLNDTKLLKNTEDKENAAPIVVKCQLDDNQMKEIIAQLTLNGTNLNHTNKTSSPIIRQQLNFESPQDLESTFKVPVIPAIKRLKNDANEVFSSPVSSAPRRSKRLSVIPPSEEDNAPKIKPRRSTRLSVLEPPKPAPRYTIQQNQQKKITPPRRSARISMRINNNNNNTPDCCKHRQFMVKPTPAPRTITKNKSVLKTPKAKINQSSSKKSVSPLRKLRDQVLCILNYGDIKEVQKLPTVGPKTALQILTFRQLNGEFTCFEDLKKIPTWKEKRFQNFMMANQLL